MASVKNHQGNKTHEQQQRMMDGEDDLPKAGETDAALSQESGGVRQPVREGARDSEFPVSQGGMSQESRTHNKHNHQTQSGHGPQKHSPAEEKH